MDKGRIRSSQMFRLWIATYADWRPTRWNESPPRATALELVEDALYSADEASLFLQGFNGSMLEHDQPVWAVAVPIKVHYEGDAHPGMIVRGYEFAEEQAEMNLTGLYDESTTRDMSAGAAVQSRAADASQGPLRGDHFQGFGQSPQRSR